MCSLEVWDKELTETKNANSRASRIAATLESKLRGATVSVQDESHRHAGHSGAQPEGETHYRVRVVSPDFTSLSRVARHRLVNEALAGEFASGLHALALELKTPDEA